MKKNLLFLATILGLIGTLAIKLLSKHFNIPFWQAWSLFAVGATMLTFFHTIVQLTRESSDMKHSEVVRHIRNEILYCEKSPGNITPEELIGFLDDNILQLQKQGL